MHYVITGNIGCGKSTAIKELKLLLPEFSFYSIDDIVAQAYRDETIKSQLQAMLGVSEKHQVRELFFSNPQSKSTVESIINPFVNKQLQDILSKDENSITEYPVVFEYNQVHLFDKVIFLYADDEIRVQRVIQRNGFTRDQVQAVMQKQLPQETKMNAAHYVVMNNGDIETLKQELSALAESIK